MAAMPAPRPAHAERIENPFRRRNEALVVMAPADQLNPDRQAIGAMPVGNVRAGACNSVHSAWKPGSPV
jgi:hypothetical protein